MISSLKISDGDLYNKLKLLTFCRVIFTTLLLSATIVMQLSQTVSPLDKSLLVLYGMIVSVFILSFFYSILLYRIKRGIFFTYIQIGIDTFLVTLIIFLTGSFSSVFSFLYLIVIIYSSMLLFRNGSMVMASLCCIQYGLMIDLEYYGILKPFGVERNLIIVEYTFTHVLYKIIMMIVACFAVAFLSSLLSEQERRTKKELRIMEEHVKRVEKMAMVGEMAAGLAHEIKNPLASLRSSIQFLKEEAAYNAEHEKLMNIILREADRLSSLVSDFLLFAKPPAGKVEIIDLGKALIETLILFEKNNICQEKIKIAKDIAADMRVRMDPSHLRQIFWNLLLNAAESFKDTGVIDVKAYPLRNKYIIVQISDNGCGIPEKTLRTIFDPFFTTKPNGTGLGLSIVHRIVESYDSWIDVESELGKGTTFTLQLKRVASV